MRGLGELTGLAPGSSILSVGEDAPVRDLERAGCRVEVLSGEEAAGGPPTRNHPNGAFDAILLWDALPGRGDVETILADAVRVVRPGGLVILHVREGDPATPSREELCAHFAGERLGVEEHAQDDADEGGRTIWLLRVPAAEASPGGDR